MSGLVDPESFQAKIEEVRRTAIGVPKKLQIDLSIALTDQLYTVSGNLFYLLHAPDDTVYIDIKINSTNQPAHRYYRAMGLETPFHSLLITTPAGQAGTITIIYGTEAPEMLRVIDNRSSASLGVNAIVAELQGDATHETWDTEKTVGAAAVSAIAANTDRKGCIVQAKSTNTGIIYIGFDNTVTATKWVAELLPGMAFSIDDYRGALFAIGSAAGQLLGWGEW